MADTDIVQVIAEARVDARSLSEFVFKPADFMVTRRLAPPINTLQFYIDIIDNTVDSIDQVLTDISASATTKVTAVVDATTAEVNSAATAAKADVTDIVSGVEANAQVNIDGAVNRADDKISTAILDAILSSGFVTVDSFELGATLTQRNEALRHATDGKLYRWAGDLPKVVPASSTPANSGGTGDNAWLEVSDVTLRQDLANPDNGAAMVAYGASNVQNALDVGVKNPSYLRVNKPTRSAIGVASRGGYRADSSPARPLVSFIDDDGWPSVYSYLFPLLKEKNIPFGLSIPSNRLGETGKITLAQLREIVAGSDVEILTHGYDELYLDRLTDEEQEHEIRSSKEQLESYGFHVNCYVPVGGVLTASSTSIIDRYFAGLFNAGHAVDRSNTVANLNEMNINRVAFGPASSLQKYKDDVDAAIANNRWLVYMTHVGAQNANHAAWLPELIDYIKSRGVEIVKPSDGLAEFGQVFRQGVFSGDDYFAVRKDGTVRSSDLERRAFVRDGSRPFDAGILEYPAKQVTYAFYNTSEANTPAGSGVGSLITYRPSIALGNTNMSYQEFFTSNGIRHRRGWNRTEPEGQGEWRDWIRSETTAGLLFAATDTAGELRQKVGGYAEINLITASFNSGQASTYGWPGAGTVVMYTGETYNSWQVFYHMNGAGISTRSWSDSTQQWSSWVREKTIKHSAVLTVGSVPARSTVRVDVPMSGIQVGASVVVGSRVALPNGIIITGHGRKLDYATIDVVNVTDTDVSMGAVNFDFKIDAYRA